MLVEPIVLLSAFNACDFLALFCATFNTVNDEIKFSDTNICLCRIKDNKLTIFFLDSHCCTSAYVTICSCHNICVNVDSCIVGIISSINFPFCAYLYRCIVCRL